jgi:hydroxymethylpyrimidine pyrophosphatase-like HAD family hydrolase
MIIAVDFDGTIVEHKYPQIGREIIFATDTLKALHKKGHQIILWTVRTGPLLDEAVAFCEERGVEFYAVNKSYPEEVYDEAISRKINADIFIDDRNLGGLIPWGEIFQMICPEGIGTVAPQIKKGFLERVFGK